MERSMIYFLLDGKIDPLLSCYVNLGLVVVGKSPISPVYHEEQEGCGGGDGLEDDQEGDGRRRWSL